MMKETEQAKELYDNIQRCMKVFNQVKYPYKENEVQFRHESIRGMLIIARSDVWEMLQAWNKNLLNNKEGA